MTKLEIFLVLILLYINKQEGIYSSSTEIKLPLCKIKIVNKEKRSTIGPVEVDKERSSK